MEAATAAREQEDVWLEAAVVFARSCWRRCGCRASGATTGTEEGLVGGGWLGVGRCEQAPGTKVAATAVCGGGGVSDLGVSLAAGVLARSLAAEALAWSLAADGEVETEWGLQSPSC